MHLRDGPTAEKGCALRCSRRSRVHTISYSATCWNSPAPVSLFNSDTDERSATVMSFSPERKEPSKAGCYASLQPWTAPGNVSHSLRELGKRYGPAAPERGLSLPPGLPVIPILQVHETLPSKGLQRTARQLRPDGLMSADSAILPSGFLRPLIPALEPPQRGRAAPRAPRGAAPSSLG